MLSWMAWTWPTAAIFIVLFSTIGLLIVLEIKYPGGAERKGALGLVTTRGDRLFLTCLGGSFIFLAWLGLLGWFVKRVKFNVTSSKVPVHLNPFL